MTGRVANKVAIVTGAASGLGAATARLMVREGATVVLADINEPAGETLATGLGPTAAFMRLDVTDEAGWKSVVAATVERFGALHILVNNAGVSPHDTIEDATLEGWRRNHAINLESVFLGCHTGIPAMVASGGGAIVNTSSIAGVKGTSNYASYGSAKAGVRNLTKSVAMYCTERGYNIRCNSVHPGSIDTPILDADNALHGAAAITSRERAIPMHRLGRAEEVGYAILFLASDEASYITGAELMVDGGMTAR